MKLYHNPRCSKSRQAKQILEDRGVSFDTVLYLEKGLTEKEIKELAKLLKMSVKDFVRNKEDIFKQQNLKDASETQLIDALCRYPKILERPIFICKNKAILARPPELVLEILD